MGKGLQGWKDVQFGEYGNLRMAHDGRYKLIRRYPEGPDELFDLTQDPRETRNRIDDPELEPVISCLDEAMTEYFTRYEDPQKSGLRVKELPVHNKVEAWRGQPE